MGQETGLPENEKRNAKLLPRVRLVHKSVPSSLVHGTQ